MICKKERKKKDSLSKSAKIMKYIPLTPIVGGHVTGLKKIIISKGHFGMICLLDQWVDDMSATSCECEVGRLT